MFNFQNYNKRYCYSKEIRIFFGNLFYLKCLTKYTTIIFINFPNIKTSLKVAKHQIIKVFRFLENFFIKNYSFFIFSLINGKAKKKVVALIMEMMIFSFISQYLF